MNNQYEWDPRVLLLYLYFIQDDAEDFAYEHGFPDVFELYIYAYVEALRLGSSTDHPLSPLQCTELEHVTDLFDGGITLCRQYLQLTDKERAKFLDETVDDTQVNIQDETHHTKMYTFLMMALMLVKFCCERDYKSALTEGVEHPARGGKAIQLGEYDCSRGHLMGITNSFDGEELLEKFYAAARFMQVFLRLSPLEKAALESLFP
jgi:hypothetical protein